MPAFCVQFGGSQAASQAGARSQDRNLCCWHTLATDGGTASVRHFCALAGLGTPVVVFTDSLSVSATVRKSISFSFPVACSPLIVVLFTRVLAFSCGLQPGGSEGSVGALVESFWTAARRDQQTRRERDNRAENRRVARTRPCVEVAPGPPRGSCGVLVPLRHSG
jgi:hypothetical protein